VIDYEIQVAGPIGQVARSFLPGFTTTVIPPSTVLAGMVAGPEEVLTVINFLTAQGVAPIDIRISTVRAAPPDMRPVPWDDAATTAVRSRTARKARPQNPTTR
jgi:hypothetical protein